MIPIEIGDIVTIGNETRAWECTRSAPSTPANIPAGRLPAHITLVSPSTPSHILEFDVKTVSGELLEKLKYYTGSIRSNFPKHWIPRILANREREALEKLKQSTTEGMEPKTKRTILDLWRNL